MRRGISAVVAVLAVCLATVFGGAIEAQAEQCTTQGAYALALAQVLKFEVTTVDAAVSALAGIGVAPDGGWKPEECISDAVTAQIRASLDRAIAGGAVPPGIGTGAADSAFSVLRETDRGTGTPVSPFKP